MKKATIIIIACLMLLSLFLNLYQKNSSPPGFDSDEAAFGYNAYSILKTGKDEYGNFLPLRLKSFGDYKMPLYSYLSIPFIAAFGLNENSTRALNTTVAFFAPLIIFLLALELFKNNKIALLAALFTTINLGLASIGRQAHEAYLAAFLVSLAAYFYLKFIKYKRKYDLILFLIIEFLSLFAYQSSRIFALFFLLYSIFYFFLKSKKINKLLIIGLVVVIVLFEITDVIYKPTRVQNLFLFNSPGFSMQINQLAAEGGSRLAYNKAAEGILHVVSNELEYLSPQFLAINGDANFRFGYSGHFPISPLLYFFFFVGIYYLFKNREANRFFLLTLIFISPLTAALSWADLSLTRVLFILIPIIIISAYGIYYFVLNIVEKRMMYTVIVLIVIVKVFLVYYNWDFYLNHYPKRGEVIRAWEAGYRQLGNYLKANYNNFDKFYITKQNGEPYIFVLFYLKYPPDLYQKQANLSAPDQYGFGQVEKFDKFVFSIPGSIPNGKVSIIGYPNDFSNLHISSNDVETISQGGQEIFWIYQHNK